MSNCEQANSWLAADPDTVITAPGCILVVEDDQETAELLRLLLMEAGYDVLIASDGHKALDLFRSHAPNAILMDLGLPGVDGFEVTELIRASAHTVPIIMLTGEAETGAKVRGFEVGADDYVIKPFSGPELLARLSAHLRRQQLISQLEYQSVNQRQEIEEMLTSQQAMNASVEMERRMRQDLLHGVNTHLQSLCAVVDTEFRRQPPGPGRDALLRVIPRMHGAALVYQIAEQITGDTVEFGELLRTIATSLKQVYSPRKRIPVRLDVDSVMVPSTIASPLAMVATELITNAFKHAFPHGRFGAITVSCMLAEDMLQLDVMDDGIGVDEAQGSGRGLISVRELIAGLGGVFELGGGSEGTRASVRLPVQTPVATAEAER